MKYIYIKLSKNLIDSLYQAISAVLISEYQEGILVFDTSCLFKGDVFKNYLFKNVNCRNTYNEINEGNYNCFTVKNYKHNLELIGEFKNVSFFINRVDEFIKTLCIDGYENEINLWLEQIKTKTKNECNKFCLNLYSNKYVNSVEHRGGWKDVIKHLFDDNLLSYNDANYYLLDIVENYINENDLLIKKKWFGIIHCTINTPSFLNIPNVSDVINSLFFKNNKCNCLGLITFSQNVKKELEKYNLNLNILFIKHPIKNKNIEYFDINEFVNNKDKNLVLLGKQLRKLSTVYLINTNYKKYWLPGTKQYTLSFIENLKKELMFLKKYDKINFSSVEIKYFDDYLSYDNFILKNIIIIDLWNANANNSVLECLVRNIPFFVSKKKEIIEYLGEEYPMYFESVNELENILNGNSLNNLYKTTYDYLKKIDKTDITLDNFNDKLKLFLKFNINSVETLFSNIKEHNNWSHIEKYINKELKKITFYEKIIFIPFMDIFILDNNTMLSKNECMHWIGILHNPVLTQVYPNNDIFKQKKFLNYLKYCKGLFVMSQELKDYILEKFNPAFFVEVIIHPLPYININNWNTILFNNNKNKKIIQVGNWLRRTYGIFKIDVSNEFTKMITPFGNRTQQELMFWSTRDNVNVTFEEYQKVIKHEFIENEEYSKLFENNIFFLDLYDSTANNVILECIKTNCPIIVNDNINIKKYLGDEYPLYYKNYKEINGLLTNGNIISAHTYMKNMNKDKFTDEYLLKSITNILKINNIIY